MATNPTITHHPHIHFLRKTIDFNDQGALGSKGTAVVVGEVPAGSVIYKSMSGFQATTVFNSSTTAALLIGTDSNDDLYGTAMDLGSTLFVGLDESVSTYVASATQITATIDNSLTAATATAGSGEVVIVYATNKQTPGS